MTVFNDTLSTQLMLIMVVTRTVHIFQWIFQLIMI